MPRRWPPWGVWVSGAMFLVCLGAIYAHLLGSGPVGWVLRPDPAAQAGSVVVAVYPESPASRAGFQKDDTIRENDLQTFLETARSGGAHRFVVEREGADNVVTLSLPRKDWAYFRTSQGFLLLLLMGCSALNFALGALIVFARPDDVLARWGALLLADLGLWLSMMMLGNPPLSVEFAANLRRLPAPLGLTVQLVSFASLWAPVAALMFLGNFPRQPAKNPRLWTALSTPGLVTVPLALDFFWFPVYRVGRSAPPAWLLGLASAIGAFYFAAAAALLLRNYLRFTDRNERRRMRVLVTGFAVTMVASSGFVLLSFDWQPLVSLRTAHWSLIVALFAPLSTAAPISTAYAILRHRMFDIRILLRLGLQYAAARGLLLSLVPMIGVALSLDLLLHGDQPLLATIRERGWLYGGMALAASLLHTRRKSWLRVLDRRFFREQYDAQQILHGVVDEIRRSGSFEEVAPQVLAHVERALHPVVAALMVREPGGSPHIIAAGSATIPPIPADSKLLALIRLLGRPVEFGAGDTGWPKQLPAEDSQFLHQARIEWVFPIAVAPEGVEALLILGPKRSEEPYSKEDQGLLEAVTGSLALLLERSPAPASPAAGFEECPECGTCYPVGVSRCPVDGAVLWLVTSSTTIAGRYRLERRLGQGGMGTVYQALDGELDRRVAVKLVRPGLVQGEEATARFRREAKAAAGFSHPNVVTIHDFGVAQDQRPYLVMELLQGSTLRQELERCGRLDVGRAMRLLGGVCSAVAAAHERGLLHRDLKPENIFLVGTGDHEIAKVLDFGLAKRLAGDVGYQTRAADTIPGMLVGTPRYMSPGRFRGEAPSREWDIWALAVVAYEMLMGEYPFEAANGTPVEGLAVTTPLHQAPPELQRLFQRIFAGGPEDQARSALQFLGELQAAVVGMAGTAHGGPPLP